MAITITGDTNAREIIATMTDGTPFHATDLRDYEVIGAVTAIMQGAWPIVVETETEEDAEELAVTTA